MRELFLGHKSPRYVEIALLFVIGLRKRMDTRRSHGSTKTGPQRVGTVFVGSLWRTHKKCTHEFPPILGTLFVDPILTIL